MEKSIYQQISEHIHDGVLDGDFFLEEEKSKNFYLPWLPGAMDGKFIYHLNSTELSDSQKNEMERAVKCAGNLNIRKADELFYELTKNTGAIHVIVELQNYVKKEYKKRDTLKLLFTAMYLMMESTHVECVKIGLAILEEIRPLGKKAYEHIRRIGLYEGFTLYVVWNMLKWENGNSEIFELAKKVHGWGRIHAVRHLRPETEEIRHWLLTEGMENDVDNAYSAFVCWEKSGAERILSGQPTEEEFKGVIKLIRSLLDERTVQGISKVEYSGKIMMRILEIAPQYHLTADDYDVIQNVEEWAENEMLPLLATVVKCEELLHSEACIDAVKEEVKEGKAPGLAKELGISVSDDTEVSKLLN